MNIKHLTKGCQCCCLMQSNCQHFKKRLEGQETALGKRLGCCVIAAFSSRIQVGVLAISRLPANTLLLAVSNFLLTGGSWV